MPPPAGTTARSPPVTHRTTPRHPRSTAHRRSPPRNAADPHAAPPVADQATASAAFPSPLQPDPVVVPSTPPCSRCCDDQLNSPSTPQRHASTPVGGWVCGIRWAAPDRGWTTPSLNRSLPPSKSSSSTGSTTAPEPRREPRSSAGRLVQQLAAALHHGYLSPIQWEQRHARTPDPVAPTLAA
jgi:hypothetical protein